MEIFQLFACTLQIKENRKPNLKYNLQLFEKYKICRDAPKKLARIARKSKDIKDGQGAEFRFLEFEHVLETIRRIWQSQ